MRDATFEELTELLGRDPAALLGRIGIPDCQLSIPTDGKGLRVLVETAPGEGASVPASVELRVGGEEVRIPLEVRESRQRYVPQ